MSPLFKRTSEERDAYLQGIRAGINMVKRELDKGLSCAEVVRKAEYFNEFLQEINDRHDNNERVAAPSNSGWHEVTQG